MRSLIATTALTFVAAAAQAEPPAVVTDIPVVGALVQQVMGDLGTVDVLLPQGGNAHSYQMRPSEARQVQNADLLIWIGPNLTPWLARATDNLGAGTQLRLLDLPETHRRVYPDEDPHAGHDHDDHDHEHNHDHDHDHEHEHEHEHDDEHDQGHDHAAEHDHDHTGTDPHAWLDPQNGIVWLSAIADALSARDPGNAQTYAANADRAAQDIEATERQIAERLEGSKDARFAVSHDAYGYFTDHFGLPAAVTLSLGDAASPSAARVSDFRAQIEAQDIRCIFPEAQHNPDLLTSALAGTDATIAATLDPSGATHPFSADLYTLILTEMGDTIAGCHEAAAR
ncbi:zinc ABC transporter substrate-binding protein [Paracoccus sp. TK19116]|uniref:High-affinity zinc uptake system protein ZnuA n=1 Tax=Paracoccus albicereus TaxID=2922394 RepID=A0ABT1MQV5_9RHOB|nr:zinc ABC transporter substrate-binding protein [Paracoccus albicereus]MCQ0970667.1 zinc ABC transporter substrate-binding protein [Paracoccus albicereus]